MDNRQIRRLTFSGVVAALTFIATYFIKIPNPIGYIHLGDGVIMAGAVLLGPGAFFAAAFGSALADLLGGYYIYILPTFLVKGVIAFIAGYALKNGKATRIRSIAAFVVAEIVMVFGYFITENFMYGFSAALGAVPGNLIQGFSGVVIGILLFDYMVKLRAEIN